MNVVNSSAESWLSAASAAISGLQWSNLQVASARFARFSYCGRGFTRYARFTSYGNRVCTIEVVKLST